jgi:hypothetical protein
VLYIFELFDERKTGQSQNNENLYTLPQSATHSARLTARKIRCANGARASTTLYDFQSRTRAHLKIKLIRRVTIHHLMPLHLFLACWSQTDESTVVLNVYDRAGSPIQYRALLDNGSQTNFVTEEMAQALKLNKLFWAIVYLALAARQPSLSTKLPQKLLLEAAILVQNSNFRPDTERKIDTSTWNLPTDIELADLKFFTLEHIDMLI